MNQAARTCPNGHPVGNGVDRFCEVCGAPLACPNGHPITNPSDRFCEVCGAPVQGAQSPVPVSRTRGDLPFPWPVLAGIGGLAVVAVAVMALFVLPSGDDDFPAPASGDATTSTPTTPPNAAACIQLFLDVDFQGVPPQDAQVTLSPTRGADCPDGEYHQGDAVTLVSPRLAGLHPVWGSTPEVIEDPFAQSVTLAMPAESLFVSVIYYEGEATGTPGATAPGGPTAAASPSSAPATAPAATATKAPAPTATKPPPPPAATATKPAPTATTPPAPTATQQVSGACWDLFINSSFYPDTDPEPAHTITRSPLASGGCPAGQYRAGEAITLSASPVPGYHPVWGTSPDNLIADVFQATVVLTMPGQDVFAGPIYFEN